MHERTRRHHTDVRGEGLGGRASYRIIIETKKRRKAALTVRTASSTASSDISESVAVRGPSTSASGGGAMGKADAALSSPPEFVLVGLQYGAIARYNFAYCL